MSLKVGDLIPIGGGGYSLLSNVENFEVDSAGNQTVRLTWKDPEDVIVDGILITEWAGTQIRGKKGNYPSNEKDGVPFIDSKNRNQYQNTPLEITGLDNVEEYFFMAFPYTDKNVFTVDSANRVSAIPTGGVDSSGSPGSPYLISGTMEEGFFGEASSSELITGSDLALEAGISQGTSINSTAGWLKFAWQGDIYFVAKKPIRSHISWDTLNAAKCIYGDSGDVTVTIDGLIYKVTLIRGLDSETNPKILSGSSSGEICHYSEWNKLICQIHQEALNKSWSASANIESDIGVLKHNLGSGIQGMYNDVDLIIRFNQGDGARILCQEKSNETRCIARGYTGLSNSSARYTTSVTGSDGWRPVLRLVRGD